MFGYETDQKIKRNLQDTKTGPVFTIPTYIRTIFLNQKSECSDFTQHYLNPFVQVYGE